MTILKYEPIVKLSYEIIRPRYFQGNDGKISVVHFKEYLEEQSVRRGGMRAEMLRKQLGSQPDHYWKEVVEAYNYIISRSHHHEKETAVFILWLIFLLKMKKRETEELNLFQEDLYSFFGGFAEV
ncbi:hypothetical protein DK37_12710 [Halomonas sp. SUBG004]|nr:hypothetical protein DK37_12710 [Halomonas sp. SUBG004]